MKFLVRPTRAYKKDHKRLSKSGFDMRKLERAVELLAAQRTLPENFRDHGLHGALAGTRACHIGPDWLLHYAIDNNRLILLLIRTGTHRNVLGIE